ncbi:MAG TPA: dihydrofolate reductase family protein [Candidatus Saccharimonadales bacterium]
MNVVLNMGISPNGLIAREDGNEDWLPSDGWDDFLNEAKRFNNIVMGRETYEVVTRLYSNYNFDNVEAKHKIIVTINPDFKAPNGYTIVHSPEEAINYVDKQGLDSLFLIGGGKLNAEFLKRKLVNEIELIITPYIIGKGRPFIFPTDFDLPLELIEYKPLSKGRMLLRYRCLII